MANPLSNIAVVILAAGASKRMHSPKQLLSWDKNTLISHAIETALKLEVKEVIVVLGANYQFIEQEIKHYPITILNNKDWALGLGKSLACATIYLLKQTKVIDGMLVTLADQPLIDIAFLKSLVETFKFDKKQIIATSYKNEKKGVPAVFHRSYFKQLAELNDDFGAKDILKKNKTFVKALIPSVNNLDIDTKEDYEALYKSNFNKAID